MNWRDIPKYIADGTYRTDVPLDSVDGKIRSYEERYGLDINPDFQRGHVWDERRQIAFVEHLLKGGQGSHEIRFNCPGWRTTYVGPMVLVDGLQRVTSVRRFFSDEITAFGHRYSEFEGIYPWSAWSLSFRINDLPTRYDVLRWYLEINTGGVVHTEEQINKVRMLLEKEGQR